MGMEVRGEAEAVGVIFLCGGRGHYGEGLKGPTLLHGKEDDDVATALDGW